MEAHAPQLLSESRVRTFVRSLTWRVSGILLSIVLTWWFTGDVLLGIEIGVAYNLIRLATHYFHDRAWARVRWGFRPEPAHGTPGWFKVLKADAGQTGARPAEPEPIADGAIFEPEPAAGRRGDA